MANAITTDVVSIGDLVEKYCALGLMIPSIQRDYKWGPGHDSIEKLNAAAYVFLEDMIDFYELREDEDIYFTGTMIVFDDKNEERTQIMDGQQRWTTITALMGTIRSLLQNSTKNYQTIIREIDKKFLLHDDGTPLLESKKKADMRSLEFLVNIGAGESLTNIPKPGKNIFEYKRDGILYTNSSLNSVVLYFQNRLRSKFAIKGAMSDCDKLVEFYRTISENVLLNYSHTKSPTLAYKMFVTANSRGTPLNNFDVFRGLVMAHNRIKKYGREKDLQSTLDRADITLQDLFEGEKDMGKAIDKIMSEAVTIYLCEKVSTNHVMSKLEHRINQFTNREELEKFAEFFETYFKEIQSIKNQEGKVGRVQNLRMRCYKFVQQIQYYATARIFWGRDCKNIEQLMDVLETIVMRVLVLNDKNISKLFYRVATKHYELIRDAGKDEEKQTAAIKRIAKEFQNSSENPTDHTLISRLKNRTFSTSSATERNKIMVTLMSIEEGKYKNWRFRNNQGNPKVSNLLPKFKGSDNDYDYPTAYYKKEEYPYLLGNQFLLDENKTLAHISKYADEPRMKKCNFYSRFGKNFTTYGKNVAAIKWGYKNIDSRTELLTKKLIQKFPENCIREA